MHPKPIVAAQLSTAHSDEAALDIRAIRARIEQINAILPLDLLIVGAREAPDLFQQLTAPGARPAKAVYLWFDVLSDYPELDADEAMLDFKGGRAGGWGGWSEIDQGLDEVFQFGCPNHPGVRAKVFRHLERLLAAYPHFDGVFFDKFRFISPAMGLDPLLACFCPHCAARAAEAGLDLAQVKRALQGAPAAAGSAGAALPGGAPWLEALLAGQPVLQQFVRFRADCITGLLGELAQVARRAGKQVGLDLFSPGLAPLVGQDYRRLAGLADWCKPMTYRLAKAPAGLRLEIPMLVRGIAAHLGRSAAEAAAWLESVIPEFAGTSLDEIDRDGVPLAVMARELRTAVELFAPRPVYMGLETVTFAGIIDVQPQQVREMVALGREAGVAGSILSWDLMVTPLANVRALKESL